MIAVSNGATDERNLQGIPHRRVGWMFLVGILLGIFAGVVEVKVGDLLLTALLILSFTMLLGALRPQGPWKWALLVAACIPLSRVFAAKVLHESTERAQIYESFLVFLPATVGAFGGSILRSVVNRVFGEQNESAGKAGHK